MFSRGKSNGVTTQCTTDDSENPEAELLLSQFMKSSVKKPQGSLKASTESSHGIARSSMTRVPSTASSREEKSPAASRHRSPYAHSSKSHLSTQSEFLGPTARRSGRQRSGPANYFEKINLFINSDTEDDLGEGPFKEPLTGQSRSIHLSPESSEGSQKTDGSWSHQRTCLIYSLSDVRILRSSYKSLDNLATLKRHARYARELNPASYADRARQNPDTNVLHVDFDQNEMRAVLNLLSFYGYRCSLCTEIPLADQVITILSTQKDPEVLVDGISSICDLARMLPKDGVTGINEWLLKATRSDVDRKKLPRVKRLINKIQLHREHDNHQYATSQAVADKDGSLISGLTHASILRRRRRPDIHGFVSDARSGRLSTSPCIIRVVRVKDEDMPASCRTVHGSNTMNRLLQGRELGCPMNRRIQKDCMRDWKHSKYWKGASNDIIVLAWSPEGTRFAAGATAQCDEHNMLYNRDKNLILGDLSRNSLKELPDHWINRPWGGAVSNQNMTDARLFMSVTAMQWFDDVLFTASYDNTVKLWDVGTYTNARCFSTLRHDSKVQVMARSNFDRNTLATGTDSIGLWNIKEQHYTPLGIQQRQRKKDMEFVPTSLAWGTVHATKNILLAGMSEKEEEFPQNGLLTAWHMNETSATPMNLSPNAQNIFDIKWHPCIPYFITGSAPAPTRASTAKSVVRVYEPLLSKMNTMEFDCPALDINDVTFCPMNPNYVTASCTDGITYVWDCRKPKDIVLRLQHDGPINQIDENLSREQADVGVRAALWGSSIDQFYSGASDGVLKQWDILRSQEDAHVQDVICLQEEIMCGALSNDKTNLLIGDAAGGVHVLSSGPFNNDRDQCMNFERAAYEAVPEVETNSESGVRVANDLLLSGKLIRHPVYGPGQGPHYKGPFASWARPGDTPWDQLAQTPLKEEHLVRQLDGAPLKDRKGLDEHAQRDIAAQIQLARIRNKRRHESKRKRHDSARPGKIVSSSGSIIDLCSEGEEAEDGGPRPPRATEKLKRRVTTNDNRIIANIEPEIIDLTLDSDETQDDEAFRFDSLDVTSQADFRTLEESVKEDIEEDFWWPESGKIDPNIQDEDV